MIIKLQRQKIRFSTFSSGLLTDVSVIRNFALPKFRKFCPTRPEGAEALSPGQRPGLLRMIAYRPVRAKALKYRAIYKAFALTGRQVCEHDNPGRCPGLRASAPSGRAAYMGSSVIRNFVPSSSFRAYWVIPTVQFENFSTISSSM